MTYSLYTDGTYYPKINTVGIGGHLDDNGGKPVWDFSEKIDNPKITNQFKIQALVHGLNKCIANGIKEVECFTDDQTLTETLNISDKVKKHNFIGRNPVFKELLSLLPKFDKIEFSYIQKNQNKIANSFARKLLVDDVAISNTVQTKSVEQGGFDLPNLLTKSKFTDKQEFMDSKVDITKHYVFDVDTKEMVLSIYEIQKYPKLKVLNQQNHNLNPKWTKHSIEIINDVLEKATEKEIGLLFNETMNPIAKILRGLEPISTNTKAPLAKLTELSSKFEKIVIHDDTNILETALNPSMPEESEVDYFKKREETLVQNLKILSDPDYKLGSNRTVEKFLDLSRKQLEDLATVQKKYLGELIRINTRLGYLLGTDDIDETKEKAVNKVAEMKAKLESKGIKLKM